MKNKILHAVLAALLLTGCSNTGTSGTQEDPQSTEDGSDIGSLTVSSESETQESSEPDPEPENKRIYPDNAYKPLDRSLFTEDCEESGTVVKFTYDTVDHVGGGDTVYQKYALVYLPAGYDENDTETRYNVMYLMHGGSDSPAWFLTGEGNVSPLSRLLDHMIASGEMEPMILCAVSYYTEYRSDDTQNCLNFHHELINDIIPVFESKYHTYAEDVTPLGHRRIKASQSVWRFFHGSGDNLGDI